MSFDCSVMGADKLPFCHKLLWMGWGGLFLGCWWKMKNNSLEDLKSRAYNLNLYIILDNGHPQHHCKGLYIHEFYGYTILYVSILQWTDI